VQHNALEFLPSREIPEGANVIEDPGGDPDSKSTSGYVVYIDGVLTTRKSKIQSITAQSAVAAELIVTAATKRVVDWFTGLG